MITCTVAIIAAVTAFAWALHGFWLANYRRGQDLRRRFHDRSKGNESNDANSGNDRAARGPAGSTPWLEAATTITGAKAVHRAKGASWRGADGQSGRATQAAAEEQVSASLVPKVSLRTDGSLAVPVAEKLSIVWRIYHDGVQPVLQVKVEREGCKVYHLADDIDCVDVPLDR